MIDILYISLIFLSPVIYIGLFWGCAYFILNHFVNRLDDKFNCFDVNN